MAPQSRQLDTFGRSLRARYQILIEQPGIEFFNEADERSAAARAEYTIWEYRWMMVRPAIVFVDGAGVFVATLLTLSQQENRSSPTDLALLISFITITLLGWILHMTFHNDGYVRIRQWLFTILRLAIATGYLIWEFKFSANILYKFSISAFAAAGLGLLFTASGSYVRTKRQRRRLGFGRAHPWNATFDLYHGTSYHLKPLSGEERRRRQDRAVEYVTSKRKQSLGERTAGWHQQRSTIASLPDTYAPLALRDEYSSTSLFSRCYCCLDSDPFAETSTKLKRKWKMIRPTWRKNRTAFLQQAAISHFGNIPLTTGIRDNFGAHRLCEKCEFICSESYLINKYSWRHGKSKGPTDEMFEHYSTPNELQQSATNGTCHLCALIWGVMSEQQQRELLDTDERMVEELDQALRALDTESEKEKKREEYHQKRCITIRLESLSRKCSYTRTAFATYPIEVVGDGPRLIPHFGRTRVPRRWENKRLVKEAIAMGLDPALRSKHLEQSGAIIIRPVTLEDSAWWMVNSESNYSVRTINIRR
jgi:hypothetical protein